MEPSAESQAIIANNNNNNVVSTSGKLTVSVESPNTISLSQSVTSATAVPTTVITSVKSAILPFPPYHNGGSEQSKENPNLVHLLSGAADHSPPPSFSASQFKPLQSIFSAKDEPTTPPEYSIRVNSASHDHHTSSQHHFSQADNKLKCQPLFLAAGFQPPVSNNFVPPQPPPPQSKHSNCMFYKGYKKLCNAQSIFKCNKSSASNHQTTVEQQQQQQTFNPNLPMFGSNSLDLSPAAMASAASQSSCILGDLLRGKQSRKKNYTQSSASSDTASLMDTSDDPRAQNGASIRAGVLAATMGDEMPEPNSATAVSGNPCNYNVSYYSKLLKKRIKKLYHDSDLVAGTDSQDYMRQHQADALSEVPFPIPRSMSDAAMHHQQHQQPSNHNRKSVISKLGAYQQNHLQQARALICSRMSELGYKLPYCNSPSTSAEAAQAAGFNAALSHQSVNSYLDSLIRTNVIREPSPPSDSEEVPSPAASAISAPLPVPTTLADSAFTTAADINPNKPHHFVNLIDKIISNVFVGAAVANSTAETSTLSTEAATSFSPGFHAPTAQTSLASVLSSSERLPGSSPPPQQQQQQRQQQSTPSDYGPAPSPSPNVVPGPQVTTSRPASNVSAITQLLNSDQSPPSSPISSCQNHHMERPSPRPSPKPSPKPSYSTKSSSSSSSTQPMDCLSDISDKVYQQLIEFEFNHESILKKFQTTSSTDPMSCHTSSNRPGLNPNEKARIEELEKVLYPLQFCLSSMCEQRAAIKKNLHKSFFQKNSNVSVDFQRQTLLATTEQAINLLIELTKQLESFSELNSADQMNLLRTSVMEIMLMRSILIMPQRMKEKMNNLKRGHEEHNSSSNGHQSAESTSGTCCTATPSTAPTGGSLKQCCKIIHQNLQHPGKLLNAMHLTPNKSKAETSKNDADGDNLESEQQQQKSPSTIPGKEDMEPCKSHPHDRPYADLTTLDHRRLEELMNSDEIGSESSRDSFGDEGFLSPPTSGDSSMAADYAKKFRAHYLKLAGSIDKDWYEDKTIFYLLFAILLFRPTKSNIGDVERVREEHLTYVYLLKRYLENKFKSYCTARSHFIRIFDRLEELQKMNDQVIQKLLDFDLVCAQNLLEKLCIC